MLAAMLGVEVRRVGLFFSRLRTHTRFVTTHPFQIANWFQNRRTRNRSSSSRSSDEEASAQAHTGLSTMAPPAGRTIAQREALARRVAAVAEAHWSVLVEDHLQATAATVAAAHEEALDPLLPHLALQQLSTSLRGGEGGGRNSTTATSPSKTAKTTTTTTTSTATSPAYSNVSAAAATPLLWNDRGTTVMHKVRQKRTP